MSPCLLAAFLDILGMNPVVLSVFCCERSSLFSPTRLLRCFVCLVAWLVLLLFFSLLALLWAQKFSYGMFVRLVTECVHYNSRASPGMSTQIQPVFRVISFGVCQSMDVTSSHGSGMSSQYKALVFCATPLSVFLFIFGHQMEMQVTCTKVAVLQRLSWLELTFTLCGVGSGYSPA